jgi:hypothetical protein
MENTESNTPPANTPEIIKIPKANFKSNFKSFNKKGEREYNIKKIMDHLANREGKGFVRDVSEIIGEERRDLLEKSYAIIGKAHFLVLLEKALEIQNEGGVGKLIPSPGPGVENKKHDNEMRVEPVENEANNEKKSTGGVLFKLLKKEGGMSKENLKEIFRIDYQSRNQKKKMMKKMEKLLLNN